MIEEAAGTKTYDMKKANALQTIEKKNAKLNEIERVLHEDITPVVEKLKQERSAYIEYQKCEREYLHLHKITLAFQFYQNEQLVNKNKLETSEIESEFSAKRQRAGEIAAATEKLKAEIGEFMRKLRESESDEVMTRFEAELKQNRMEAAKLGSELGHLKTSTASDAKKSAQIQRSVKDNERLIEQKQVSLDEMSANVHALERDLAECEAGVKKAQTAYEAVCCGFVVDEDTNQLQTIQDQLLGVRTRITECKTSVRTGQLKLANAVKESEKLKRELDKDTRSYDETQQACQARQAACDKLKVKCI